MLGLNQKPQISQFTSSTAEVAVSLNTNEVQILSRSGNDWTPTETLSEVDLHRLISITSAPDSLFPPLVP